MAEEHACRITWPLMLLTPLAQSGSGDSSGLPQAPKKGQEVDGLPLFRGLFQAKCTDLRVVAAYELVCAVHFMSAWRYAKRRGKIAAIQAAKNQI
mgnify:CR=1 FL=1